MKKIILSLLIGLFCSSCAAAYPSRDYLDSSSNVEGLLSSVVVLMDSDGADMNCSGFWLDEDEVMTAAHCVEREATTVIRVGPFVLEVPVPISESPLGDQYEVISYVQYRTDHELGNSTTFEVVAYDDLRDLAILRVVEGEPRSYVSNPVRFYTGGHLPVGARTISAGHPAGQLYTINSGRVNRAMEVIDGVRYMYSNSSIYPGSSGGPLFNEMGYVVGVCHAFYARQGWLGMHVSHVEVAAFLMENRQR